MLVVEVVGDVDAVDVDLAVSSVFSSVVEEQLATIHIAVVASSVRNTGLLISRYVAGISYAPI